jgi:hypothetical protein
LTRKLLSYIFAKAKFSLESILIFSGCLAFPNNLSVVSPLPRAERKNMTSIPTNRKILFFSVIVLIFLAEAIPAQEKKFGLITVVNKAASLTIVAIDDRGPIPEARERGFGSLTRYDITVRNDYDRPIEVYKLEGWDETTGEPTNESPAGTFLTRWTIEPDQQIPAIFIGKTGGRTKLVVEAVIFDDGSADGDPAIVAELHQQRQGAAVAYRKLIPLLREAIKTNDAEMTTKQIAVLIKQIENIGPDNNFPEIAGRGFSSAKSYLSIFLRRMIYSGDPDAGSDFCEALRKRIVEMESGLQRFATRK